MTPKEIAEKYVYGKHDALTDNQEVIDMIADIEAYANGISTDRKSWYEVRCKAKDLTGAGFRVWWERNSLGHDC